MDWKPYDDDNSLVKKKRFQSESWVVQTHWHCYIQTVTHEIAELKGYSESVRRMLSEMSFMIPKWKHWRAENHEFSQQQIGNSVSNSSITMQKYILLNRIFFRVCVCLVKFSFWKYENPLDSITSWAFALLDLFICAKSNLFS